jgi:hypothetical protein
VCKDIIRDYEETLAREFRHHKELQANVTEAHNIIADKAQEIEVLKKIGATGVSGEQHRLVVGECERLKFINEELERDIETLKQRIYDLEHPPKFVEPKRPKKVYDALPKVQDIVVLEDSVRKPRAVAKTDADFKEFLRKKKSPKATKKPVKKAVKRGQKRGR